MCFLVNGCLDGFNPSAVLANQAKTIEHQCGFNREMSVLLANVFSSLYAKPNQDEWRRKEKEGLFAFVAKDFFFKWNGFSVWDNACVTVDCSYTAEITLRPTQKIEKDKEITKALS